jgi:hypothetical protein
MRFRHLKFCLKIDFSLVLLNHNGYWCKFRFDWLIFDDQLKIPLVFLEHLNKRFPYHKRFFAQNQNFSINLGTITGIDPIILLVYADVNSFIVGV